MSKIFISYRRVDRIFTERISERLKGRFGANSIFKDVDNIPLGQDFRQVLASEVQACDAVVVVIGPNWSQLKDDQGNVRLTSPHDFVRSEIELALERDIPVIPLLLENAPMPSEAELPESIKGLAFRHATQIRSDPDFDHDLQRLCEAIGKIGKVANPAPIEIGACPYRGLEAFQASDADVYFGREDVIDLALAKIGDFSRPDAFRFLAIIGASGSGKSSLANAGILPKLTHGARSNWPVVRCRPGHNPIEELAVSLGAHAETKAAAGDVGDLIDKIAKDERRLHLIARLALEGQTADEKLILLVDQFEELFRPGDTEIKQAFIRNLLYAAQAPDGKAVVLLTMRADFYAKASIYPDLANALARSQVLVGPMTAEQTRDAIDKPAQQAGASFEPGLVDLIVDDMKGEDGALPFLQDALTQIWERQQDGMLTLATYKSIGRLKGAIEHRANAFYESLTDDEKKACRWLFLRLTQPGEGTEDTKRRVKRSELGTSPHLDSLIEQATKARLITAKSEYENNAEVVSIEVSHEALIRGWSQLRTWIDEDRDSLKKQHELTVDAGVWRQNHDEAFLYRGTRLAIVEEWLASDARQLTQTENEFLAASKTLRNAETRQRKRAARRLVLFSWLATAAAAIAVVMWFRASAANEKERAASQKERTASENERAARVKSDKLASNVASEAGALRLQGSFVEQESDPSGLLYLAKACEAAASDPQSAKTTSDLWSGWYHSFENRLLSVVGHSKPVTTLSVHPSGNFFASGSDDGEAKIWTLPAGEQVNKRPMQHDSPVTLVDYSPDGQWLVTCTEQGDVTLWPNDDETKTPIRFVRDSIDHAHSGRITSASFHPDGKHLLTTGVDGLAIIWSGSDGKLEHILLKEAERVQGSAISKDGSKLLTGHVERSSDGKVGLSVKLWRWSGGVPAILDSKTFDDDRTARNLLRGSLLSRFADFSRSGDAAVVAVGTSYVWFDISAEKLVGKPVQCRNTVWSVGFSSDGRYVMGSDDLNTTLVSTENVGELAPVRIENAHEGDVYSFAISPNSRMVATCSWDSTIRLWDLNDNKIQTFLSNPESPILNPPYTARSRPLIHFGRVWAGEFSHDGRYFISASSDGTARVWNVAQANGVQLTHNDVVNAVRISPDSSLIATASDDLTVKLWNRIGESISIPLQHTAAVSNVEWSPNGRMLAAGTSDGEVVLWNAQGNRLADLNAESSGAIIAIRFSPDSKLLATANFEGKNVADYDILVSIWDTQAMQQVGTSFSKHVGSPDHARAMSFSPDGTKFACADNNKFSLWNTDGFEKTVESEAGPNQINALLFLGNDKLVVSDWSGLTRIWDISQGLKAEHKLEHKKGVAFTSVCAPSLIVTGSEDGSLRFWDAKSGTLNGKPLKQTDTPFWTDVSQDGRIVASMAKGGPASSLWQVSTSLPFYYWSDPQIVYAHGADLSDDGKLLAIPVNTDAAILINVSADNLSVEEIRLRSILATCAELSEDDKVVPLDWNNWQGVRKQLEELTKSSATTEVISEPEWHKSQIAEHTHAKDYSAAIWHADRLVQFDLKNGANWLTRGKLHQLNEENDAAILDLSEADKLGEKEAGLLLATSYMKLGRFNEAQPIALAAAKSQGNEDIGRLLVSLSALDVTPYSNQELLQQAENLLGKKAYDLELSASQKLQTLARECLLKEAVAMQLKSVKDTDAEVLKRAGELVYSVYPAAKYGDPLEAFQRAAKIVLDPHLSDEEYRLAEVWSRVTFEHSTAPLEKIAALITQGTASFRYKNFEQAKVLLVKAYNDANSLSGQRPELKSELTPMFANIFSVLTMVESQVGNNEWAPKYVGNIEEYIVGMQPSVQGSEAAKQLYGEATAVFLKTFGQREVFNSKNFKPGDKLWNLQFAVWLLTASDTEHAEALTLARAAFAANAAIAPSSPLGAVTDLFDGISPPRFDWLSGWILAQSGQFDEALRELTPVAAHIGVEFQDMLFYATALDGADRKPEALGAAKQARELLTSAWGDDTKLQALPIVERLCLTKLSERLQQLTEELEQEIKSAKQESEPEAEPVPEVEKVAEPVTAAQLKPEQKPASEPQPTSEPALSPEE